MKKIFIKFLSTFLAILLALQCFMLDSSTINASASTANELSNWSIRLDFLDEGTLTDDYTMTQNAVTYGDRQAVLQVSVSYTGDGSVVYAPEDVSFEIADLRDIVVADVSEHYTYDVAAELKGSNSGRGDWYYEVDDPYVFDLGENVFTFTNKNEISGAFTSTFQISMEFYPLCSAIDFSKDFSTTLTFNNLDGTVTSNTASFSYQSGKATYEIIPSYTEIEDGISDEILGKIPEGKDSDDYIFADVQIFAPYVNEKVGNVYKTLLEVAFPSDVLIGNHTYVEGGYRGIFENAKFTVDDSNKLSINSEAYDYYLSAEDPEDVCLNFYVAFPREKYTNLKTYNITFNLSGVYMGEEEYVPLDSTVLTFNFSEFNYVWEPGYLYSQVKMAYSTTNPDIYRDNYDDNYVYENMLYAYNNHAKAYSDEFIIKFTAVYTGTPMDIVIGDDLSYFVYADNTYRKVEDDERFATEVYLSAMPTVSSTEVYGRVAGSDSYELIKTYGTSSSSKTLKLTKEYCDIMVKFIGITGTIQEKSVWIDYSYVTTPEKNNGKVPVKVYNFSYMDVLMDDEPIYFVREDVTTNITGLDKEIDTYDTKTYGKIQYRATDYKTILDNALGIDQSMGSGSTYDGDSFVTDDTVSIIHCEGYVFYDYQGGGNTWCDFTDTYILPLHWDLNIDEFSYYFSNSTFLFEDGSSCKVNGIIAINDLPEKLKSQITIDKTTLSDGRVQVTVHYDFTDNKLVNDSRTFCYFKPYFEYFIDRDTFEMLDMNGGKAYVWVERSLNEASSSVVYEHPTRKGYNYLYAPTIVYSTYQGVSMESSVDGETFNAKEKSIESDETYEYKLMLHTGNSKAKYVTFFDTLDNAYGTNSYWQGSFLEVDTSAMEAVGATPKVYYSTNAAQAHDLSKSGWTLSTSYTGSLSNVKAIAVDLGTYEIESNSLALVTIKLQAPDSLDAIYKTAYNNCTVNYKSYDASLTNLTESNASETITGLTSNTTKIYLGGNFAWAYVDGVSGNDANNGLTPATAVRTFEQAYENIKSVGGTIYVVNTVTLSDRNYTLTNNKIIGERTVTLNEGCSVRISRYSQPNTVISGFEKTDHLNTLILIPEAASLTLENIVIDGHKNAITSSEIEHFIAGGVIASESLITNDGSLFINTGSILQNNNMSAKNASSGGAIFNTGILQLNGGTIIENKTSKFGGGIYNVETGTITFTKVTPITKNQAANGGGICSLAPLTLNNYASITENKAIFGAGIYMDESTLLTINGATIAKNIASQSGGGIWLQFSDLILTSGKITQNEANWSGGAIYLNGYEPENGTGLFTMNGGEITNNKTGSKGAGIYNYCGAIVMNDGTISYNGPLTEEDANKLKGGGVYLDGDGTFTMNSGDVSHNKATLGGGVYLVPYGVLTKAYIQGDALITENEATSGGGIMNFAAELHVSDSAVISKNRADWGGGIYNYGYDFAIDGGTLYISGGMITENEARCGSGIYNGAYYADDTMGGQIYMTGGTITNNKPFDAITTSYDAVYNWLGIIEMSDGMIEKSSIGIYNMNGTVTLSNHAVIQNCDQYGIYQDGVLQVKETPIVMDPVFLTPDHYITVIDTCTSNFITAMDEEDTFEGRVLANYTFDTSGQKSLYSLDSTTKGFADAKEIEVGDKTLTDGTYPYCILLVPAILDSPPTITVTPADDPDNKDWPGTTDPEKGSILEFYEGETVTKEMLLENVMAYDNEDGDITDDIRIIKITYSEGKVVGDSKLPSYEEEWSYDMPDDACLDTWFMQIDADDSPVSHTITYAVTDSTGNEAILEWTVKVKYNEAPEIQAEDRYFTLQEAQDGLITEELLLSDITASDLEDDALYGKGCLNDNVKILSFNPEEFKNFDGSGYVVLTLYVHDSMGPDGTCDCVNGETSHPVGKEALKQIVIYIVDGQQKVDGPNVKHVRFIDKHYYNLNKDKYKEDLSKEEKNALHKNGGLHVDSLWYVEDSYRSLIEGAFAKTEALFTYTFDEADVDTFIEK